MPIIRGKEASFPMTDQPQGGRALRGLGVRFQGAGSRGWRLAVTPASPTWVMLHCALKVTDKSWQEMGWESARSD